MKGIKFGESEFELSLPGSVRAERVEPAGRRPGGTAKAIIRRALERDSFNVVTASRGEQGLRLAHEMRPDAITLDVMMPEMDGWSVLRALKADPALRDIPVIMVSMIDDRTRGYALGAVDYLTKPVDRAALRKTIDRYKNTNSASLALLVEDDTDTRAMMARTLEKPLLFFRYSA